MAKALFLSGHSTIIIDATNTTKERRDEWKKTFPDYNIHFQRFFTSKKVCIERAKGDGREDLIPVIENMANNFQEEVD